MQILLNFFVAVILDNLEDDDQEKMQKLEKELKKQKIRRVPRHLKLVVFGGPKRLATPKIASAQGVDMPNLTEADVRSFYKAGEASELPQIPFQSDHTHFAQEPGIQRQSSELSNLGLLTSESSEVRWAVM